MIYMFPCQPHITRQVWTASLFSERHEQHNKHMLTELRVDTSGGRRPTSLLRLYHQYSPHHTRLLAATVPQHTDPLSDAATFLDALPNKKTPPKEPSGDACLWTRPVNVETCSFASVWPACLPDRMQQTDSDLDQEKLPITHGQD